MSLGAGAPAPSGGLLAVHAHPDDETLSTGALLATWATAGLPTTVVTCTRGERGEVIGRRLAHLSGDPGALAAHRLTELAAALASLGVEDHVMLDEVAGDGPWVDSGMIWQGASRAALGADVPEGAFALLDVDTAADRLARVVRDRRPTVLVTYEPDGGYGHPDHVQAHRVAMRAVELAAHGADGTPAWTVPCVLWVALESEALDAGRAACSADLAPGLCSAVGRPQPSAAVPADMVDVRVDVRPVVEQVVGALGAHATQVQALRRFEKSDGAALGCYALSDAVVQPLLAQESYRMAPGSTTGREWWPAGVRVR